ncbi:hypothetical protein BpHYR1_011807 [Brachionus plicatilis]|uniref:Uncharacterized protein n=1 Tax=Brachionus plicatilis TaxID=10195 RepID=A0A3M7PNP5_BRAPC|nr:hypothetical protein BpHYR1_011807 [Brachionus plicatilis]
MLRYFEYFAIFKVKNAAAVLPKASLNLDPFGMNFTFSSFPRSNIMVYIFLTFFNRQSFLKTIYS